MLTNGGNDDLCFGLFSLFSSFLFNFSFFRLEFISLLSCFGVLFKTPCPTTSASINSLSSWKINTLVGGKSFNWTTRKYIFFFSSSANFLVASVKADIKGSEMLFPAMPSASLVTEHLSPVGSVRCCGTSSSSFQCLPVLSAQYCTDRPSPLFGRCHCAVWKKQPFRARVFYINKRAKVLKTKLDRCSYV